MKARNIVALATAMLASLSADAITLPAIFADGMVLQQQSTVKMWGWGKPKEPVCVVASWSPNDTVRTEAAADATWSIELQTPAGSSTKHTITISGWGQWKIENVLVGEVLLCSGQSNMEWSVGAGFEGKDELVAAATNGDIRMFNVDYRTAEQPTHDVSGRWIITSPETVGQMSVIGYVIARRVAEAQGVPVGIVNTSWGGTPIECWTPAEYYESNARLNAVNQELKQGEWGPCRPGRIYNAMVEPLGGYVVKGCVWYQGEENTNNPSAYADMLRELCRGYRALFGAEMPFIYAQIAPYNYGSGNGVKIREHQRRAMDIERSAMVVIGDLGDTTNIHPQKKTEAGNRLANAVLKEIYGKADLSYEAPLFKSMTIAKGKATIAFSNADGLHLTSGKTPDSFEIAGDDGKFCPAQASLKGSTVVVWSKSVKTPVAVRYAWSDTAMPNLSNAAGVQASCFTTEKEF